VGPCHHVWQYCFYVFESRNMYSSQSSRTTCVTNYCRSALAEAMTLLFLCIWVTKHVFESFVTNYMCHELLSQCSCRGNDTTVLMYLSHGTCIQITNSDSILLWHIYSSRTTTCIFRDSDIHDSSGVMVRDACLCQCNTESYMATRVHSWWFKFMKSRNSNLWKRWRRWSLCVCVCVCVSECMCDIQYTGV